MLVCIPQVLSKAEVAHCRRRLEAWGELDTALLLAPSYHLPQEEIAANYRAIADAFAA